MVLHDLPRFPARFDEAHKGTSGRVLIIGGSRGMAGAIALTGMAALRTGTGLVTVATPEPVWPVVAGFCPSYMTWPLTSDKKGRIHEDAIKELPDLLEKVDAVAVGPGLGRSKGLIQLIEYLYRSVTKPMVIDADGLNNLAELATGLEARGGARVLTPHPGEFRRLVTAADGETTEELTDAAAALADKTGVVILLKGKRTLVTDGERRYRNPSGSPALATGGTGDVLTGMIASLLGQGLSAFDAATLGAYLHGRAGERLAGRVGIVGSTSTDLLDDLPQVIATDLAERPPQLAEELSDDAQGGIPSQDA